METKTGNTWAPFCMHCNHVRKGDKDKCHVCSYPLETICLGCGTSPDQGEHECKVITIPANPLAAQSSQLRAEVVELKQQRQGQGLLNVKLMREAKATELQICEMRRDFESIVIRCREGDPKVDWIPTILRIAEKHKINETRKWKVDAKGSAHLEPGPDELEMGLQSNDTRKPCESRANSPLQQQCDRDDGHPPPHRWTGPAGGKHAW